MKKLFAIIITITMCFTLLTACTYPTSQGSSNSSSTSVETIDYSYEKIDVHFNVINDIPTSSGEPTSSTDKPTSSDEPISTSENNSQSGSTGEDPKPVVPQGGDLKTVLKSIRKTVVEVYAYILDEKTKAVSSVNVGSGVIVANSEEKGLSYIVTCHDVIEDVDSVEIKTIDGETFDAKFIGSDPDSNLCVMSIEKCLPSATVYTGLEIEVGEEVVAIGNALGNYGGTVTTGIISASYKDIVIGGKKKSLLLTDAAVNEGNSGGGLFTKSGYLIGIVDDGYNKDILNNINGIGVAIPSGNMLEVTTELMRTYTGERPGYIEGKYNLGLVVNDYYSSKWTTQPYVYILSLDPSGCLYKAGLKVNDRLVSVVYGNETYEVTNAKSFVEFVDTDPFKVGDTVTFNIIRNERASTVQVPILQYIYGLS